MWFGLIIFASLTHSSARASPPMTFKVEGLAREDVSDDKALVAQAWEPAFYSQIPDPTQTGVRELIHKVVFSPPHSSRVMCTYTCFTHDTGLAFFKVESSCFGLQDSIPFLSFFLDIDKRWGLRHNILGALWFGTLAILGDNLDFVLTTHIVAFNCP